jgi:hypothetical protein
MKTTIKIVKFQKSYALKTGETHRATMARRFGGIAQAVQRNGIWMTDGGHNSIELINALAVNDSTIWIKSQGGAL